MDSNETSTNKEEASATPATSEGKIKFYERFAQDNHYFKKQNPKILEEDIIKHFKDRLRECRT